MTELVSVEVMVRFAVGQEEPLDSIAAVETVADLAAALDRLRQSRGLTYADLARAARPARLAPSTVSGLLGGEIRTRLETMELFLRACGLDDGELGPWRAAWERAGSPTGPAGAVRVEQAQPRRLGVHAAIDAPGAVGQLPIYVERDTDTAERGVRALLGEAKAHGGMVVLVGGSSVGKTRCAYEAVRALMPQWWLLHPADADRLRELAATPYPRTVVWLDELQRYLGGEHGLDVATVRVLLQAGTVLVATLWPQHYTTYTAPPLSGEPDLHRAEREVLDLAEKIHLNGQLSIAETDRARQAATTDSRIRLALESSDYGMTQVIAAAPQLVDRWCGADPYQKAVLTAAIDAVRLGARTPLSAALLRAAAPGYCDQRQRATALPNWFETALAYATEPLHGATATLSPVAVKMGQPTGYVLADYLLQHASAERRTAIVPATAWDAYLTHVTSPSDQRRLGIRAEDRLLYRYAEPLYQQAAEAGDRDAAWRRAQLLIRQGRAEEALALLRTMAEMGDRAAAWRLTELLAEQGRVEELLAQAKTGNRDAAQRLADLFARQGREREALALLRPAADTGDREATLRRAELLEREYVDEALALLRTLADTGDREAALRQAELLAERGRVEELQARAESNDGDAAWQLAHLMAEQGRMGEALALLRTLAEFGDKVAARRMADWTAAQGQVEEALALLRTLAKSGDKVAVARLSELLVEQGQVEELRARAESGDGEAAWQLAQLMAEQGRMGEALALLRTLAESGDKVATGRLADLMAAQVQVEEALVLLRTLAESGDEAASWRLADLLAKEGRVEELLARAESGDRTASWWLADLLAKKGQVEELRARAEFGDGEAALSLIGVLSKAKCAEEAERVRRFGLPVPETDGC